jgi:outer membrane receptor protein involved in Fe transport
MAPLRSPGFSSVSLVLALLLTSSPAAAQSTSKQTPQPTPPSPTTPAPVTFRVDVVETTPLPGVDLPREKVAAPVQADDNRGIESSNATSYADYLERRVNGVHVNEIQNNPFQPDVNYRGYTASPLLGTPQGLSVYMDGVRLNQPFGDVVSWDLIPRAAIASTTLMPGSNPLFGLNTLGGALSVQTKDGRSGRGTTIEATGGSDARRVFELQHGGQRPNGLNWYLTGTLFDEEGWREDSPSTVRQIFGKAAWQRARGNMALTLAHADNTLNGNGLQDVRLLERDYGSVYTKPDVTDNQSTFLNVTGRRSLGASGSFSGNAYYRRIQATTLNGDINEESLDQSLYQPGAAEQAALAAAGYTGFPTSGANASNTPFPSWRCIANGLLGDEPAEKCNGLINRGRTDQHNAGLSGQWTSVRPLAGRNHQITIGAAWDRSDVDFRQSTELGYLNPDRSVTGIGAFGDGETGGDVDGEPFDARVDLDGVVQTWSFHASDTIALAPEWSLTVSGRYNHSRIRNRDRINPGGGPTSLDGDHVASRFNPAAGLTWSPTAAVNLYAGYSEGSRAATSIELGCANPEAPCKLPNAMAGDPPLDQVVTRTIESGVRGRHAGLSWNAGVFRAQNTDDILFVTSDQTGYGYFRNFGRTERQGIELGATQRLGRLTLGAGYTFLSATYESEEQVNGESNSSNDVAEDGEPGMEGSIEIEPGNRLPLTPRHLLKAWADVEVTGALTIDIGLVGVSSSFARGNENNRHEPDGLYYLGEGTSPGYAVVNLGATYRLTNRVRLLAQVNNLFDRRYYTAAQLGPAGFTESGAFVARPLPAVDGEFPLRHTTFYAPGAPLRAFAGARVSF